MSNRKPSAKSNGERAASSKESFLGGISSLLGQNNRKDEKIERRIARELLSGIIVRAGKGKDDIIQIFSRELGLALVGMLKDPLQKLIESKKIQITIEVVPVKKKSIKSIKP